MLLKFILGAYDNSSTRSVVFAAYSQTSLICFTALPLSLHLAQIVVASDYIF